MLVNNHSIETVSGRYVDFLNPNPDSIVIEDIAWALSQQCRYNGHSQLYYSVADHSLAVAEELEFYYEIPLLTLCGLLHDATEAYVGDIPTPLKKLIPDFKVIEKRFEKVILEKFDIYDYYKSFEKAIKRADINQLRIEAYHLLPSRGEGWPVFDDCLIDPSKFDTPNFRTPPLSADAFENKFNNLMRMIND